MIVEPINEAAEREQLLTLADAARAVGVSKPTVRARVKAGKIPGAVIEEDGTYRIPLGPLLEAFPDRNTPRTEPPIHYRGPDGAFGVILPGPFASPAPDLEQLARELAEERKRREDAEQRLAQTEQLWREDRDRFDLMLRALPAASAPQPAPRQRWWRKAPKP